MVKNSGNKIDDIVKVYKTVKKTIPKISESKDNSLMRFGLTLLLELAFIFII